MTVVGQHFRPEFLNRIDDMVVFHPLSRSQIMDVARIQLRVLQDRISNLNICVQFDKDALDFITEVGYDPVYGARPLKRAIQKHVENRLAQELLAGVFKAGDKILVQKQGEGLGFSLE
ncbi:MAG: hypothetical protein IIB71_10305 [Proteobacteria bacterium]|nr:hypothetical protein [Pseudomonadota bacterium]